MAKKEEVRRVPNIRFPGFEEDWQMKKLGDLLEFKMELMHLKNNMEVV